MTDERRAAADHQLRHHPAVRYGAARRGGRRDAGRDGPVVGVRSECSGRRLHRVRRGVRDDSGRRRHVRWTGVATFALWRGAASHRDRFLRRAHSCGCRRRGVVHRQQHAGHGVGERQGDDARRACQTGLSSLPEISSARSRPRCSISCRRNTRSAAARSG